MHTNIAVLTPDSFDASVALASRPTDGVGLGVAGGLGNDGGAGAIPGTQKRRWLVAFCARWAPPCNLLVREFALIGSRPDATSFALGRNGYHITSTLYFRKTSLLAAYLLRLPLASFPLLLELGRAVIFDHPFRHRHGLNLPRKSRLDERLDDLNFEEKAGVMRFDDRRQPPWVVFV